MTEPATGSKIPPPPRTRLIVSSSDRISFTANRETDVRTALTRGMAEYLEQVESRAVGGRILRFKRVLDQYSEPEKQASYPSATIYTMGTGTYDASNFTPSVSHECKLPPPDNRYLVKLAEYRQDLGVELWCNDLKERNELVAALEEAMNPVTFMYGFRLELPFYFNQRATYEMTNLQYLDTEEDAIRRFRRALITVTASVPLTKLASFPVARPLLDLKAVGPDVDVVVNLSVS